MMLTYDNDDNCLCVSVGLGVGTSEKYSPVLRMTALMHTATWYDILHHLWYGYCGVE